MAINEIRLKEGDKFTPTTIIKENVDRCFVEFVDEEGESLMISCHGNNILIHGYSPNRKNVKMNLENIQEFKPEFLNRVILSVKKETS